MLTPPKSEFAADIVYCPGTDTFSRTTEESSPPPLSLRIGGVPLSLCVRIGTWCNYECTYCLSSSGPDGSWASITLLSDVAQLLRSIGGQRRVIVSGGEPAFFPHLEEGLEALRRDGHRIVITTNGSRFIPFARRVVDWVDVSLHGFDDKSHRDVTGITSSFSAIIEMIRRYTAEGVNVSCSIVAGAENVQGLGQGLMAAVKAGAKKVRIDRVLRIGRGRLVGSPEPNETFLLGLRTKLLQMGASVVFVPSANSRLQALYDGYFVVMPDGSLRAEKLGPSVRAVEQALAFMKARAAAHLRVFVCE